MAMVGALPEAETLKRRNRFRRKYDEISYEQVQLEKCVGHTGRDDQSAFSIFLRDSGGYKREISEVK